MLLFQPTQYIIHRIKRKLCNNKRKVCNVGSYFPVCNVDFYFPVCNFDSYFPVCNFDSYFPVCNFGSYFPVSFLERCAQLQHNGRYHSDRLVLSQSSVIHVRSVSSLTLLLSDATTYVWSGTGDSIDGN